MALLCQRRVVSSLIYVPGFGNVRSLPLGIAISQDPVVASERWIIFTKLVELKLGNYGHICPGDDEVIDFSVLRHRRIISRDCTRDAIFGLNRTTSILKHD